MVLELCLARPDQDPRVAQILDAAYARTERESRLVLELAQSHPGFDPGLALLAVEHGEALGWALFLPREIRLCGAWVKLAVAAPIGVFPHARLRGAASFLLRAGLHALKDRGIRGALVISENSLYHRHGFMPAWNSYTQRVSTALLPKDHDTSAWVGITSAHLAGLQALQEQNYAGISGSERRYRAAIDWESAIEGAHTLVWAPSSAQGIAATGLSATRSSATGASAAGPSMPQAFVRFRKRAELEITEAAVASPAAACACLQLFRRLAREHKRGEILTHLPPPHPLARELSRLGAVSESNELGGAGLLCVTDWDGVVHDTREHWEATLRDRKDARISLGVGARVVALELGAGGLVVTDRALDRRHAELPQNWSAGLLSGQRTADELLFNMPHDQTRTLDAEAISILHALFPGGTPAWTYAPVFEIADE